MTADFRADTHAFLNHLICAPDAELARLAANGIAEDSVWDIAHPVHRLEGRAAILDGFIRPLRQAIPEIRRRDEIFIGGHNIRAAGGTWCAAVTHYVGNLKAPLFGVDPHQDRLVFLRSGEFYRIDEGQITEAKILFDLPDLMRQTGRFPFPQLLGTEMLFPGPATHDGVLPADRRNSDETIAIIEGMIASLHAYDPNTFGSEGQTGSRGFWHADMLWYGPAGIGSNYRWDGFVAHHRAAFLSAFPDRRGGDHYCRFGDGDFAAISGWPSMTMTHQGDYLGVKATHKSLTLRVMDFYRCAEGQIRENWVCLDYGDLFDQMGVDLVERARALSGD